MVQLESELRRLTEKFNYATLLILGGLDVISSHSIYILDKAIIFVMAIIIMMYVEGHIYKSSLKDKWIFIITAAFVISLPGFFVGLSVLGFLGFLKLGSDFKKVPN